MLLFPASATMPLRLYLDESGTLGFGGEVFTMAMVLVSDLAKLESSIARNKTTQAEIKASQMRTPQKLELAKKLLEENDLQVFLLTIDPAAAYACERKLDKELLYDSMIAQAMAYYLQRGDLPQGRAYRLSLDMRGGIRESFEDMVRESIGNVLMHRDEPLVSDLQVRFMDSKYSAGVQVADLFSNIYRTTLSAKDSPCNGFLHKYMSAGVVHAGFSFGLRELADQMSQIAADLRARVEYEERNHIEGGFRTLPLSVDEQFVSKTTAEPVTPQGEREPGLAEAADGEAAQAMRPAGELAQVEAESAAGEARVEDPVVTGAVALEDAHASAEDAVAADASMPEGDSQGQDASAEAPRTLSRSARRRRSRAARKAADAQAAAAAAQAEEPSAEVSAPAETVASNDQVDEGFAEPVAPLAEPSEAPAQPQDAAPARTRRPGWRAKAEVQAKAEKAAARAKADKAPEAQADVGAADAHEDAAPAKSAKPGRSRSAKARAAKSQAEQEPAQGVAPVETSAPVAPAAPSPETEPDEDVVEGASGHTARERRQMAAQKSGARKRSRKAKADGVHPAPEQAEPALVEPAPAEPAGKQASPAPAEPEPAPALAEPTPAATQSAASPAAEVPAAPSPAPKPAAKRTRSRKAKPAADQAVSAQAPAAEGAPTAPALPEPSPEPASPESPATPASPAPAASEAPTLPDGAAPKPKRTRTRTRKTAAKPAGEPPAAE